MFMGPCTDLMAADLSILKACQHHYCLSHSLAHISEVSRHQRGIL